MAQKETRSRVGKAFAHGLYLGATGDSTRLRKMSHEYRQTSLVAASWRSVGEALTSALEQAKTSRH